MQIAPTGNDLTVKCTLSRWSRRYYYFQLCSNNTTSIKSSSMKSTSLNMIVSAVAMAGITTAVDPTGGPCATAGSYEC
ncbi:hypothetical protein K503DRAFT_777729 [Rhizopogon vinicolor AM-OR11-026]|uniref:Uncharacterized protein n=1 Tax=Rhizopogon vinicolor AM-OR11-026 TaxID=1314800 RepID=A0A1B7MFA8_9AGAM|nr:hypothetical protein K503DRAFT_777729 [Rhizopogon vinicolor AM-OR11-026]